MAEETEQNRSEQPTQFKLARAREKGAVARGGDLGFLTALAGFFGFAWIMGPGLMSALSKSTARAINSAGTGLLGGDALLALAGQVFFPALRPVATLAATIFLAVLLFEIVQTGVVFTAEPLRPDFGRLNPAKGLKRLFSVRLLIETGKNVLKIVVYASATAWLVREAMRTGTALITDGDSLATALGRLGLRTLAFFLGAAVVFAALDQLIARRDFLKRMRMSRREIRRESRDREGDPRLKQQRKKMHAEFVKLSQSLRGVRGADVMITNPDHFAVALKYDPRTMTAPRIVSVGSHGFAQRLKRLAFIYGVTVVRRPDLARALFRHGALNAEIPDIFYQAVADIYLEMRARSAPSPGTAVHA